MNKYRKLGILLAVGLLLIGSFIVYQNRIRLEQMRATTYEGQLPCADCSGLKTELTLYRQNNTYYLRETYVATRDGDKTFTTTGKWKTARLRGRQVIQLNYDRPEEIYNFLIVDDQHLRVVDRHGEITTSPFNMTLTRK
ncbi:MAG: copper resistance protein NlpE N-terminal domain-containing protein [Candidatus Margulisiibacteriota bacterium]